MKTYYYKKIKIKLPPRISYIIKILLKYLKLNILLKILNLYNFTFSVIKHFYWAHSFMKRRKSYENCVFCVYKLDKLNIILYTYDWSTVFLKSNPSVEDTIKEGLRF